MHPASYSSWIAHRAAEVHSESLGMAPAGTIQVAGPTWGVQQILDVPRRSVITKFAMAVWTGTNDHKGLASFGSR